MYIRVAVLDTNAYLTIVVIPVGAADVINLSPTRTAASASERKVISKFRRVENALRRMTYPIKLSLVSECDRTKGV